MRRFNGPRRAGAALALAALCSVAASAALAQVGNPVRNPSFENPKLPAPQTSLASGDFARFGQWRVHYVTILNARGGYPAFSSHQSLELNSDRPGNAEQFVLLPPAAGYTISVEATPDFGASCSDVTTPRTANVYLLNQLVGTLQPAGGPGQPAHWTGYSIHASSPAGSVPLNFFSTTPGNCGVIIDQVKVTPDS
jgi:hypothetical protein